MAEGVLGWGCADKVDDAGAYFWGEGEGGHLARWGARAVGGMLCYLGDVRVVIGLEIRKSLRCF